MKITISLVIATLTLSLAACEKMSNEAGDNILIFDYNDDLVLSEDSGVVVRIGNKVIRAGEQLELDGDWEYLRKSNEERFTGLLVSYYESGSLYTRGAIKNGRDHGLYESFTEDGVLLSKFNYLEGEYDGVYETFHDNGQIEIKGSYRNGKADGTWQVYRENGALESRELFKDGELHGLSFKNSMDGKVSDQKCYQNDELVDLAVCEALGEKR